ncbi:MAG: threonine/serine dehydratase [Proteobacteria bacterium]|nr:threonine/serine dehydratase [Pseudomonadota bacterium]
MTPDILPDLKTLHNDIVDAAERLRGIAVRTPLLECPVALTGGLGRVLIKAEVLQHTGSFKFRGAYNFISQLDNEIRNRGIVAFSSGNHAQAVAAVSKMFDTRATIVMPADAPRLKIEATRDYGANVVLYDRRSESREAIAAALVNDLGATLVPPYDHHMTIAGQGTVGLEIMEDLALRNLNPDIVLVPCSGGGLVAGSATAIKHGAPDAAIYAVEPEGYDDTARSLRSGRLEQADGRPPSICDALLVQKPGDLTFSINRQLLAGGLVVTDAMARTAMAAAFRHLKLVVEPGGAVALAAVLNNLIAMTDKTIIVVCSGGNVDPDTFTDALNGPSTDALNGPSGGS